MEAMGDSSSNVNAQSPPIHHNKPPFPPTTTSTSYVQKSNMPTLQGNPPLLGSAWYHHTSPLLSAFHTRKGGHRRAHSEIPCHLSSHTSPCKVEEEEDPFSLYIDVDKLNAPAEGNGESGRKRNGIEEKDVDNGGKDGTQGGSISGGGDNKNKNKNNNKRGYRQGEGEGEGEGESTSTSTSTSNAPSHNYNHVRSVSMDSVLSSFHNNEKAPRRNVKVRHSHSSSMDGNLNFKIEFDESELNKIMSNEKLAQIAMTNPKRAKRILANRQSAARSKERKMRYISELERKVQTLQTEATALSAQLTLLQKDSMGLTSENNELKLRLQSVEQQAQLRDALNEALSEEVQRLKLATTQQISKNLYPFQLQDQGQHVTVNHQFPPPQHQQQQQQVTNAQQSPQRQINQNEVLQSSYGGFPGSLGTFVKSDRS